jgi:hypothetical protein
MKKKGPPRRFWPALLLALLLGTEGAAQESLKRDPGNDKGPWGFGSGAEWSGEYPRFNPLMAKAGVTWLRLLPEWQALQPRKDEWNWTPADDLLTNCRNNKIHPVGLLHYMAAWATTDGSTRRAPLKDEKFWRDYVHGMVARYQKDIKHWEVYNEFNGSFSVCDDKPRHYADLVKATWEEARKADPEAKIGLSCANFDLGFFDAAIKAGAANHFDFVCVHPYENLALAIEGGEDGFLSLAGSVRRMLEENKQRRDMPLWITEIGFQSTVKADPKADAAQAEALVKAYILSLVQGFERIFWFEARGPAYGQGTDHGLIRADWSARPAYEALRVMTGLLGPEPEYLGWLAEGGSYGFVFKGPTGAHLVAWSPAGQVSKIKFGSPVRRTELTGEQSSIAAGREIVLGRAPVFLTDLPSDWGTQARSNARKRFPWGGDYARATEVSCVLAASNIDKGIKQMSQGTTTVVNLLDRSYRRSDVSKGNESFYVYFRVDPAFVPFGTKELEITVVARRIDQKPAGMGLTYESLTGYKGANSWWTLPEGDQWSDHTWKVNDANFVGGWGWNFRTDGAGGNADFLIREVRVKKTRAKD